MTMIQGFEDVSYDDLMDVDGGWSWGSFFNSVVSAVSSVVNAVVTQVVATAILTAITVAFPPFAIITGPAIAAVNLLTDLAIASTAISFVKNTAQNLLGGSTVTNSSGY